MDTVLVLLIIHVNVILGGLALIVLLTVDATIILLVIHDLVHVTSVKIGLLGDFVNTASKLLSLYSKLKKIILFTFFNNYFISELGVMVMLHHSKDVINVIAMATVMNNWVFVIQIQANVTVNILLKETIANFAKKDFLETQSNNSY